MAHLLLIGVALCLDVIRITLGGMLRLFFRVSCSFSRTLCLLDLLGVTWHVASTCLHSSASVASGYCLTNFAMISYCDGLIHAGWPPPCGLGA
jgi:hypothetical protein